MMGTGTAHGHGHATSELDTSSGIFTKRSWSWMSNPPAERVFGYGAAEMVGLSVERIIIPDFVEAHRAGLARYRATGHGPIIDVDSTLELPARYRDGSTITVDLSLSRLEEPGVPGRFVLAVIRDATDRHEAAQRAAELIREQAARAG